MAEQSRTVETQGAVYDISVGTPKSESIHPHQEHIKDREIRIKKWTKDENGEANTDGRVSSNLLIHESDLEMLSDISNELEFPFCDCGRPLFGNKEQCAYCKYAN